MPSSLQLAESEVLAPDRPLPSGLLGMARIDELIAQGRPLQLPLP